MRIDVNACGCARGCTDNVWESAHKFDSGRKISCRTGESNLPQRRAGPTLSQLSYIPAPFTVFQSIAAANIMQNVHGGVASDLLRQWWFTKQYTSYKDEKVNQSLLAFVWMWTRFPSKRCVRHEITWHTINLRKINDLIKQAGPFVSVCTLTKTYIW